MMITGRIRKIIQLCVFLLCLLCAGFFVCKSAVEPREELNSDSGNLEFYFYPDNVVLFHDTFGLLCTNITAPAYQSTIGAFDFTLNFDHTLVEYESIYSSQALVNTELAPGTLRIRAGDAVVEPGVELCSITWKALATGIADFSLTTNIFTDADGIVLAPGEPFTATVKILKELGVLYFGASDTILKGTDFTKTLYISPDGKRIKEYDIDVFYNPKKITLNTMVGNNGILQGTDGFLNNVSTWEDGINIRGIKTNGAAADRDLEFLIFNWYAADSGRVDLSFNINKIVTTDNVYIKPEIRAGSFTIEKNTNKPVVDIWMSPALAETTVNSAFNSSIMLNTEGYVLAAYGIDIFYPSSVLELDTNTTRVNGIEAGADGFLTAANSQVLGEIKTAGFDLKGKAPNPELELLKIYWKAVGVTAQSDITIDARSLSDIRSREIDRKSTGCTVIVHE